MNVRIDLKIRDWIEILQSNGKSAFSLEVLYKELPGYTATGIKRALSRLTSKGKITSIHKGYYLIIPPQYASRGVLPPSLFLDSFMESLKRPYYLALLNAASFYGAAHQQPQEFFVVTNFPVLRPTHKNGIKINYISKKEITEGLLNTKKTESGYIKISNPILTALDLIQFEKRVGGINRVATVLSELIEEIRPDDFNDVLLESVPVTALQRLGYILDKVIENSKLADSLYRTMEEKGTKFFRIPLKSSVPSAGFPTDERWKVIINAIIDIDA